MENDDSLNSVLQEDSPSGLMSMMKDMAFALPGIDEAMSFAQVMKYDKLFYLLLKKQGRRKAIWSTARRAPQHFSR